MRTWGYFEPNKTHFLLVILGCPLQVGVIFPFNSQCPPEIWSVLSFLKCRNQYHSFTKLSLVWGTQFQVLCRVMKIEGFRTWFPPSRSALSCQEDITASKLDSLLPTWCPCTCLSSAWMEWPCFPFSSIGGSPHPPTHS